MNVSLPIRDISGKRKFVSKIETNILNHGFTPAHFVTNPSLEKLLLSVISRKTVIYHLLSKT